MTPPEDQGNAGECVVSRVRWSAWPHRWDARGLTAVEPVASRGLGCAGPPNGRERGISAGGRVVTQAVERVATRVRCSAWPHRWGARGLSAGNMMPGDPPENSKPWGRRVGPAARARPAAEVDDHNAISCATHNCGPSTTTLLRGRRTSCRPSASTSTCIETCPSCTLRDQPWGVSSGHPRPP